MFLPLYILVAVVHIVAKNNNYYIKTPRNPDFDVRVRRDARNSDKSIDFNVVPEINEKNDKEGILLKKIIKIDSDDDGNIEKLSKSSEHNSNENGDNINSGGITELMGYENVLKEVASIIVDLKELLNEKNINAHERVRREVESAQNIEGGIGSDIADSERNVKLWNEILSNMERNIENLLNNISKLQYEDVKVYNNENIDTKVKREADNVKIIAIDDKINDQIIDSKNNAKVLKEIASVVDEVKEQIMEYKDYIGKNRNVNNRVRKEVNRRKIVDSDVKTSVDVTEPKNNAKVLKEIVSILSEIQELISEYKKTINDVKELKKPHTRVKREANPYKIKYAGTGLLDTITGSLLGYNDFDIGDEVVEMKNRDKELKEISLQVEKRKDPIPKNKHLLQLFPQKTLVTKILLKEKPEGEMSPQEVVMEKLIQTSSKENVEKVTIIEDDVLKKKETQNIPKQGKKAEKTFTKDVKNLILKNEDEGKLEGRKISEKNDTVTPGDLIQNFGIKRKNGEGNGNQIINFKDDREDITNLKIDDDIQTKIRKAFDNIDNILEIRVLENSAEEEKIMDETGVKKHTKSVQGYEFVVDYTNSDELKDVEKLKIARTKDDHFEGDRLKQVSRKDGTIERPKRSILMKILKGPTILNKNPVKREASPENRVSKFFSNIYTKVYDMTHWKKDKDVESNVLLSDSNYNSYDSLYQANNFNNNQNSGYNQYENNHISDNGLTHSDYTYSNNYDNNKYGYNTPSNGLPHSGYIYNNNNGYDKSVDNPTNSNMYGYGYNAPTSGYNTNSQSYNTPTNGINTKAPTYNYNYASGYNYNQPTSNGLTYSPNGYPYNPQSGYKNGYITPINGNNLNNPPDYKYNYGYNTTSYNGYGYNSTQNYGYGYNTTMVNELNNNGTTTEATIVPGCIFCGNFGCQKNYRWMGVACVPIKG